MLPNILSPVQLQFWDKHHYLVLRQPLASSNITAIGEWTDQLAEWPETPGKWMKYFETGETGDQRMLCRVENFIQHHHHFQELIEGESTLSLLNALMGEPAVLFKEKINFKLPGGSGFAPHQDAPAFTSFGHTFHITMMITIDDATVHNGCLEFSTGVPVYQNLSTETDGTIARSVVQNLPWTPLETQAGDIVFFDSYIPHRSPPNKSECSRRAAYVTYNRASEGSVRDQYFADKRSVFPPECERSEGVDYAASAGPYNLGNPIR
jgi:ectoine hydroxylase-related dioxygenase (phytanoyl-CoA dioxygenase family)